MVQDGQTVVIGGIMRDRVQEIETGIPILKDLPLIGALFRRTEKTKERTELMVFLTPRIVRMPSELEKLTEEERRRSRLTPPLPILPKDQKDTTTLPPTPPKGQGTKDEERKAEDIGRIGQGATKEGRK
jgi:general secretion pathway protein D